MSMSTDGFKFNLGGNKMVERCDFYSDEEFTAAVIAEQEQYALEKESRDFEAYCAEREAIQK